MSHSTKKDEILHDHNHDGIDRRGFLKCMAWAGTGALCVIEGGILKSAALPSQTAPESTKPHEPGQLTRRRIYAPISSVRTCDRDFIQWRTLDFNSAPGVKPRRKSTTVGGQG